MVFGNGLRRLKEGAVKAKAGLKKVSEGIISGTAKAIPKVARGAGKATAYGQYYGGKAKEKYAKTQELLEKAEKEIKTLEKSWKKFTSKPRKQKKRKTTRTNKRR